MEQKLSYQGNNTDNPRPVHASVYNRLVQYTVHDHYENDLGPHWTND